MPRTIAIGDIHGCLPALETLLAAIRPQPADTLVLLGDYVDRGPNSRGVIQRLLGLQPQCHLVPLLGNHDEMMLAVYDGRSSSTSIGCCSAAMPPWNPTAPCKLDQIPAAHIEFLRSCRLFYESDRHFYVHGNYLAELPLEAQPTETLLWESLKVRQPGPHCSGKTAIVGHTSQNSGEILDLGYLKCIDTRCYGEGWLTALDVESGQVWQADKNGRARD